MQGTTKRIQAVRPVNAGRPWLFCLGAGHGAVTVWIENGGGAGRQRVPPLPQLWRRPGTTTWVVHRSQKESSLQTTGIVTVEGIPRPLHDRHDRHGVNPRAVPADSISWRRRQGWELWATF